MATFLAAQRLCRGTGANLFEVVIGLEIHSQIASASKLFSSAGLAESLATTPNLAVSLFDAAHPGTLPSPNLRCLEAGIATAQALHCKVQGASAFDRKHYYYADLPAGFQITQAGEGSGSAIAVEGSMTMELPKPTAGGEGSAGGASAAGGGGRGPRPGSSSSGPAAAGASNQQAAGSPPQRRRGMNNPSGQAVKKQQETNPTEPPSTALSPPSPSSSSASASPPPVFTVRIERIQVEQDSGKSSHGLDGLEPATLVDLNRAGVGLLEIVTRPDLRTAQEAGIFLRRLHGLLRHIGVCEGAIEEGQLRCDVNVSIGTGPRVEMKNVASIRAVERAIECEAARQIALLEGRFEDAAKNEVSPSSDGSGSNAPAPSATCIRRETRLFDAALNKTQPLRSKEGAADYRFLPEPDILPLFVVGEQVSAIEAGMPPLPEAISAKLTSLHGLSSYDADVLLKGDPQAPFFYDRVFKKACAVAGEPLSSEAFLACSKAKPGADQKLSPLQQRLAKAAVSWQSSELYGRLASLPAAAAAGAGLDTGAGLESGGTTSLAGCLVTAESLGELVAGVVMGRISGLTGKKVLDIMFSNAYRHSVGVAAEMIAEGTFSLSSDDGGGMGETETPLAIVSKHGWLLEPEDEAALTGLCQRIIDDASSASAIAKYKQGHERAAGSIVARVIKESGGKANPASVARIVAGILGPCERPPPPPPQQQQLK